MDAFAIAFLCTGNRFRSALAAAYVHRLTLGLPVDVTSFGTLDLGSAPALREAVVLGRWSGVDLSDHRSTHVGSARFDLIDLVLGFESAHIRDVVVDMKAPRDRTFMLTEFVDLLEPVSGDETADRNVVGNARAAVKRAADRRRSDDRSSAKPRDVPDPLGRSWKTQSNIASDIRELAIALVTKLFGLKGAKGLPPVPRDVMARPTSFWRTSTRRR